MKYISQRSLENRHLFRKPFREAVGPEWFVLFYNIFCQIKSCNAQDYHCSGLTLGTEYVKENVTIVEV